MTENSNQQNLQSDFQTNQPALTTQEAIANLQQKDDLGLRYYAAWWLGRFRIKEQAAIDALLIALEDETAQTPDGGYPLRRNAAKALGKLGNLEAIPALIKCLDCSDYYVRESAAQALEMLGDSSSIPALLKLLSGGVAGATQVTGKPHLVQPYEAIIEALGTLGAVEAIPIIEPFCQHFLPKVKYAAARAMYQLTQDSSYGDILVQALERPELQLRRAVLIDLGAIGYVKAGKAVANTLAENSLKLISLKGLLEYQLKQDSFSLSPKSIELMEFMDGLL